MPPPRNTTWKHGSLSRANTRSWCPVPIALTTSLAPWRSAMVPRKQLTWGRHMCMPWTLLYVQLSEHYAVSSRIIKQKMYVHFTRLKHIAWSETDHRFDRESLCLSLFENTFLERLSFFLIRKSYRRKVLHKRWRETKIRDLTHLMLWRVCKVSKSEHRSFQGWLLMISNCEVLDADSWFTIHLLLCTVPAA